MIRNIIGKYSTASFKKSRVFQNKGRDGQRDSSKMSIRSEDDDIHAQRLSEALKVTNRESDDLEGKIYKFQFFKREMFKQLKLDDCNIVNINNDEEISVCAKLKHNLELILKNPGIYPFDQIGKTIKNDADRDFLRNIYPVEKLKLDRFDLYLPPSKDTLLMDTAVQSKMKYIMSTSTISNFLCQIYYALSGFKNPFFESVFMNFEEEPKKYMISQRKPISNYVHRVLQPDGSYIYAMDGDKGLFSYSPILMNVGKIVERQLTFTREEFEERFTSEVLPPDYPELIDHHRFMKLNNEILLRSQIDCHTILEDGTPMVFEIKSRAACPMRYDFPHCMDYTDYLITQHKGLYSSYEREFYDLIRGAFLKWSFQMRIGRMDGAFIAYHNIRQIQGFEYVKASEVQNRIFGSQWYAETVFMVSSRLLTTVLDELFNVHLVNEKWESLKIGVYASSPFKKLVLFVELFENRKDIEKYKVIEPTEEIQDEYAYFEKVQPLVNKVLKFEVLLQMEVNGVVQVGPTIAFRKGDNLNVLYLVRSLGTAQYGDYMNFLHDCYKFEEINLDLNYAGAWLKNVQ